MSSPSGWLVIDKPVGPTSAQVVGKLKWALRQAGYGKAKIGHGGTLDPLASGVLPIALGEATKVAGQMLDASKVYEFTIRFGRQTDTLDLEGEVVANSDYQPGFGPVETVLEHQFTGEIAQVPPAYSALLIDGVRAYDRARAGEAFDLPLRRVTIHGWEMVAEGFVGEWDASEQYTTLRAHVSKGTYIRSLARDIALALGTVGHVTMLRRLKSGPFRITDALALDKCLELVHGGALEQALKPLMAGLDDIPVLAVDPQEAIALQNGQRLLGPRVKPGRYVATTGSVPVALVSVSETDVSVLRGFNLL